MGLQPIVQYCTVFDVQDYMSAEGLSLNLDDDSSASGQWIYATVAAVAGATALACQPLPFAMPAGNTLDFGGSNMPRIVTAVLASAAPIGSFNLTVQPLPGNVNQGAVAVDGGVNAYELARVQKGLNYAAAKINNYALPRYQDPGQLATSWTVNAWATVIASRWIAKRAKRGCPQGIQDDYEEAINELQMVSVGSMQIGDLGTPVAEWPAWSNIKVDPSYWLRKARVERQISESAGGPPQGYAQSVDWDSEGLLEI